MNTVSILVVKILSIMIFILATLLSVFNCSPNFTEDVVSACVFIAVPIIFFYDKLRHYNLVSIVLGLYVILIHFGFNLYTWDYNEVMLENNRPNIESPFFIFFAFMPELLGSVVLLSAAECAARLNNWSAKLGIAVQSVALLFIVVVFVLIIFELVTHQFNLLFYHSNTYGYLPYILVLVVLAFAKVNSQ